MLISSEDQTKIEDICSEDAVVERLKSLKNNNNLERSDLVKLATQGASDVQTILREFIRGIAQILVNVSVSLAPEEIYLSSPLLEELPTLFAKIKAFTEKLGLIPRLYLIGNSNYATLLGASSLIIHHVLQLDNYNLKFHYQ